MSTTDFINKASFKIGFKVSRYKHKDDLDVYRLLYGDEPIKNRLFLNIGAGVFKHPEWINLDHRFKRYKWNDIDVDVDLSKCKRFPFSDNTFHAIYCSHTIEHLYDDAVKNIFRESYRTLRNGGIARFTTPDAAFLKTNNYYLEQGPYEEYFFSGLNNNIPHLHRNAWDEKRLEQYLISSGFTDVYRSEMGKSRCPVMQNHNYFDTTAPYLSIFMEAKK